jgi:hypothetical protein
MTSRPVGCDETDLVFIINHGRRLATLGFPLWQICPPHFLAVAGLSG